MHHYIVDITMATDSMPVASKEAGAPDSEIEITPAMIEAGIAALRDDPTVVRDCRWNQAWNLAEDVIRHALAARSGKTARRAA
jgi:hypothetical protein